MAGTSYDCILGGWQHSFDAPLGPISCWCFGNKHLNIRDWQTVSVRLSFKLSLVTFWSSRTSSFTFLIVFRT